MNVVFIIRFLLLSIAVFANGYLCYKEPLWWLAGLSAYLMSEVINKEVINQNEKGRGEF